MAAKVKEVLKTGQAQRLREMAAERGFRFDEAGNPEVQRAQEAAGHQQRHVPGIIETLAREKGLM